ncbi:tRNA uridine-5-carboxymethylaminomethyl(34) synthesis GTPase MnmE [Blattabacterium cuenoti]|uniref:tRNA uridine-5-carboxymethylaminomethyl(34) synthesis GTPase MnmE n=1 Tax=Blattabacterium cuenoti TaxID=1653831 RepID=UPI00163C2A3F|nr:tRNA uridine-5-carboxymethylaminomethyl(34) synthesis GTPase MnmE [Blattabacterium cuenoti]
MLKEDTTIIALATPFGTSAISVIRISGKDSISMISKHFHAMKMGKKLYKQSTHTIHLGYIQDDRDQYDSFNHEHEHQSFLDQVLVSIFKAPFSYTGENMVEISCHGSEYIQQKIIQFLIRKGMRLAYPGEFTFRAFMNKKLDLSQAEAIFNLISSKNDLSHEISLQQIKGSIYEIIQNLKKQLLHVSSLLELELDFDEDHLVGRNKEDIDDVLNQLKTTLSNLVDSFSLGNAIIQGIGVVIIGETNVGKSTFFNQVIQEERSITSPIKGTTRDFIEGTRMLRGILFRFLDTAGIRKTEDEIEQMGIQKTLKQIETSTVILYILDSCMKKKQQKKIFFDVKNLQKEYPSKTIFVIANKSDISSFHDCYGIKDHVSYFFEISSKNPRDIQKIINTLEKFIIEQFNHYKVVVIQHRHYEAFRLSLKEIKEADDSFNKGISEEIISIHLKRALQHLEKITGKITSEDILNNIFSQFCIGK